MIDCFTGGPIPDAGVVLVWHRDVMSRLFHCVWEGCASTFKNPQAGQPHVLTHILDKKNRFLSDHGFLKDDIGEQPNAAQLLACGFLRPGSPVRAGVSAAGEEGMDLDEDEEGDEGEGEGDEDEMMVEAELEERAPVLEWDSYWKSVGRGACSTCS